MSTPVIVLASSSPYRRALLERLRLPFTVAVPGVEEAPLPAEAPHATALRLAEAKARAIAPAHPHACIIGSDQVAVVNGRAIGKPGSFEAARAQLLLIRGRTVVFHTALCLLSTATGDCQLEDILTTVRLREYTQSQAERYAELEPAYDCAGSAQIESLGIALVEHVESRDPTALIGLPLIALVSMLKNAGVEVL